MEERLATPALQEFPQLQRLAMFNGPNQGLIADYRAYLRARHYAPSVLEGTIRALKSFAVLMPEARQALHLDPAPPSAAARSRVATICCRSCASAIAGTCPSGSASAPMPNV